MKKFLCTAALLIALQTVFAQTVIDSTRPVAPPRTPSKTGWKKTDLSNRGNDHILLQFGVDSWGSVPDSVRTKGLPRHFNIYFMLDKPFKTNPKFSVAFGVGVGSSNIFFDRTYVDVKSNAVRLPFKNQDSTDHFKKFKLTTAFLEAPVELRYNTNPATPNKSYKIAIGGKVGTLISAGTKGKTLENRNGQAINNFIEKEKSKKFFNGTRLVATMRVGYGIFSLHGTYQITNFLKDGAGPEIRPYSVGLTISGL